MPPSPKARRAPPPVPPKSAPAPATAPLGATQRIAVEAGKTVAVIRCMRKLGGILRAFPFAAHLAKMGRQVFIECADGAKSVLSLASYVAWKDPALGFSTEDQTAILPELFDLQIFPGRVHAYRTHNPPMRYAEFLESLYPQVFKGMRRDVVFDRLPAIRPILEKYRLPADYDLACPIGSIESESPIFFGLFEDWLANRLKLRTGKCYYLAGQGWRPNRLHVCVTDLAEIAALVRHAMNFATINAAPAVMASALFEGERLRKSWHHVSPIPPRERYQDDILAKEQTRWEVNLGALCPYISQQKKL